MFRYLKADEIEVRPALIKQNGIQLLLYKDARCDMNILDECIGAGNWQRDHKLVGDATYCGIGIRASKIDETLDGWVWKWDAGSEGNIEKDKSTASDSFKRAGFNWSIGRELYSSPFIWIPADKIELESVSGRVKCKDKFFVNLIACDEGKIVKLVIARRRENKVVFTYGV